MGISIRVMAAAGGFGGYLLWRFALTDHVLPEQLNRWLIVAGLANTAYLLMYYAALVRIPVAVVTPVLGISTILVVGIAALLLQEEERVTWQLGTATLVVVAGIMLVVHA